MFEDEEINQPDDINISGAEEPVNEPGIPEETPAEAADETLARASVEHHDDFPGINEDIDDDSADETVTVQPVEFASFEDLNQVQGTPNKNLDILLDVKLQLTVELGRTELPIKKVLELTRGSIITLDKVAGEPVELFANGKLIAHGEVVVIEDNFGLRITNITDPEDRLANI